MIRLIFPLSAAVLALLLGGCLAVPQNPTQAADAQHVVRRNLDGSTTQGVEILANYNGKRVLTLQADPMGTALGVGQDVGRGVRSMTTQAQSPQMVSQYLDAAPAAPVVRREPACAPQALYRLGPNNVLERVR